MYGIDSESKIIQDNNQVEPVRRYFWMVIYLITEILSSFYNHCHGFKIILSWLKKSKPRAIYSPWGRNFIGDFKW